VLSHHITEIFSVNVYPIFSQHFNVFAAIKSLQAEIAVDASPTTQKNKKLCCSNFFR
jgi:hypothetical protein